MDGDAELPLPGTGEMEEKRDLWGLLKVALALTFIGLVVFIALGFLRYFMVRYYGGW